MIDAKITPASERFRLPGREADIHSAVKNRRAVEFDGAALGRTGYNIRPMARTDEPQIPVDIRVVSFNTLRSL